ncbi:hypothetical protein CMI37_01125 [Candidatus Pacearchaeota archaeon]|nr:hypothetical protein [Candidatus Pacearchaeota archaeon]|tara:strand:+ start:4166 stop:4987 length:822 start_codon:yes stop_codon:yes gene_type:complete
MSTTTTNYSLNKPAEGDQDWATEINDNWDTIDGSLQLLVLRDGTRALTANWDVGAFKITASQLASDVAIGTAPLVITSTTVVANLNVDQVDGKDSTDFVLVDGTQAMTGALNLDNDLDMATGAYDLLIIDNNAAALEIAESTNKYMVFDSTDGSEKITVHKETTFNETVSFDAEFDNGNSSTADTVDWGVGNKQKSTMTGNCTYTFTAPNGPCNVVLKLVQDGAGSRTATWPAAVKWPAGAAPTLSTGAAAIDLISFYWDGANYFGQSALNFS